jgi:hypothetical protein
MMQFGGAVNVINGGSFTSTGQFEMTVSSGTGLVNVGNGVGASSIVSTDFFFSGFAGDHRGATEMKLNAGGLIRATSVTNSIRITEGDTLTLNGGVAEIAAGGQFQNVDLADAIAGRSLLRGSGTIQRITGGGSNFTITSAGDIRPGDTSATPVTGTITVTDGDLAQSSGGVLFLNFTSGNTADLIDITGGTANIAGSIDFSILGGYTPVAGDIWNFLRADSITINPTTLAAATADALSELTAAGYAGPVDFGVVADGGSQVLQLALPEPASLALLALGGVVMLRRRRA